MESRKREQPNILNVLALLWNSVSNDGIHKVAHDKLKSYWVFANTKQTTEINKSELPKYSCITTYKTIGWPLHVKKSDNNLVLA